MLRAPRRTPRTRTIKAPAIGVVPMAGGAPWGVVVHGDGAVGEGAARAFADAWAGASACALAPPGIGVADPDAGAAARAEAEEAKRRGQLVAKEAGAYLRAAAALRCGIDAALSEQRGRVEWAERQ
eukprot:gene53726-61888_t